MRSGPVNLAAAGATPELFVIDFGKRLKLLNYVSFADFLEWRIAAKATGERSDRTEKVKATDHLDRLFVSVLGTRAITVPDHRVHEQAPISRKQSPVFAFHYSE